MHLARSFLVVPVPLPIMPARHDRLSAELSSPEIRIKQDQCTGLSIGGDMIRKFEFLMTDRGQ